MEILVHIIGWSAAAVSSGIAIPQALKIYRHPSELDGVSVWSWALLALNATLWLLYAVLSGAYPIGAPSLINGPLAAYIIIKVRTQKKDFPVLPHEEPSALTKAWMEVDRRWDI